MASLSTNQKAADQPMRSELTVLKTDLREPRQIIVTITLSHNSDIETSEFFELGHGFFEFIIIRKCCYDSCYFYVFGQF